MVYSPEMVALLQQLRSRIFAEFGTRIRLADPELLTAVGEFGRKSRDPFTRKTVIEIMKLGGLPFDIAYSTKPSFSGAEKNPGQVEIMYRGTKVFRDKGRGVAAEDVHTGAPSEQRQSRQMYRGQVVYK